MQFDRLKRREFISVLGAAAAWGLDSAGFLAILKTAGCSRGDHKRKKAFCKM
jgi:hypothetical protein